MTHLENTRTRNTTTLLEALQTRHPMTLLKDLQKRHPDTFPDFWREEEVSLRNDGWTRDYKALRSRRKESTKDPENGIVRLVDVTPIPEPSTTKTPRQGRQTAMPLALWQPHISMATA